MKKIILVLSMFTFLFAGCGTTSPTEVVDTYFKEISKGSNANLSNLLSSAVNQDEKEDQKLTSTEKESLELFSKSFKGKVLSETIDGDIAKVKTEVSSISIGEVLKEMLGEVFAAAFSGKELSDDEMNELMLTKMKDKKATKRTGTITLKKANDTWKIEENDALSALLVGFDEDMMDALSDEDEKEETPKASASLDVALSDDFEIRASEYEEDKDIFVINATYTNTSEETTSATMETIFAAFDEDAGIEIERAYDAAVDSDNESKDIRPNAAITFEIGFYIPKNEKPSHISVEVEEAFSFSDDLISKKYKLK
ncbi:MAG: DUF5067 domain-containing protein [Bacilli bacterium]